MADQQPKWQESKQRIQNALVVAGKRAALADQVGVSEGQLSKLLNGELTAFCRILEALGLEVYQTKYVESLHILYDEHRPRFSCVGAES